MFEPITELVKALAPIVALASSQYKKAFSLWQKYRAAKPIRLKQSIEEIDRLNENPAMLIATLAELRLAAIWISLTIVLEVALLKLGQAMQAWEILLIGSLVLILLLCLILLLMYYGKVIKRQRNPVKYKAILEIEMLEYQLEQNKAKLLAEHRLLTPDDLTLQVAPYRTLKPLDSH